MSNSFIKKNAEYFLIPGLVCLAVFWRAPFVWFRTDDFAWLGLRLEVHGPASLVRALFRPEAEGTVRVLSERLYFLIFSTVFGVRAAPFRWFGLATWIAASGLAGTVGKRVTGSRNAGIAAAVLWTLSGPAAVPLMWSAAYNQVLCVLLMLAALYARARWLESGEGRWRAMEWAAYLAGFGAQEVTVMYPLAALSYTWWVARKRDPGAWALVVPAIGFGLVHWLAIARPTGEVYRVAVDGRLPHTVMTYAANALGPDGYPGRWIFGAALAGFAAWRMCRRDWRVVFAVAWFAAFLAPVLVLPNHILYYYLTIPLLGVAWVAGWAIEEAWRKGGLARAAAIAMGAVFAAGWLPAIETQTNDWLRQTSRMRTVYRAAEREASAHPGLALVFNGVDDEVYQAGFEDEPFRLMGVTRVYLVPAREGSEAAAKSRFAIREEQAERMEESGQAEEISLSRE